MPSNVSIKKYIAWH